MTDGNAWAKAQVGVCYRVETFYMLKHILESKDAIISTLAVINVPVDTKWKGMENSERGLHHSGALWGGDCGNKCRKVTFTILVLVYYYTVKVAITNKYY